MFRRSRRRDAPPDILSAPRPLDKRETLDSQRRDFSPILRGESLAEDTPVFVLDEYGPTRMIRARTWKYVHRYPDGPNELYNLADDPFETRNLVDRPTAKPSSSSSDDKRETLDSQRRDFSPAPKGESLAEDTPVFVLDEYGPTRMIRARTWKYVHRYLDGPNELYNLANDPFETRNLVDSPDRQTPRCRAQNRVGNMVRPLR